jgi:Calcineurin-like phosphoesterase
MDFRTGASRGWRAAAMTCWCLGALALVQTARAAQPDGPYLLRDAGGAWEAVSVGAGDPAAVQRQPLRDGATIHIPAVGKIPAFDVKLRGPAAVAEDALSTAARSPVFVVADTHGEFEVLVSLLQAHRVIGPRLEWRYGRGHLVILGDVFDRGPNQLEILWLLYRLEADARAAGGGAHLVLGNHETMVLRGDLRYLHPKYIGTTHSLGVRDYAALFAPDTLLGQWLRTRPVMFRINDLLCLHGGISRALLDSTLTLQEINGTARDALDARVDQRSAMQELVLGSLGPLWYRGYFPEHRDYPAASSDDVDLALETFGARRILIGHTIVPTVTPLFDGRVIAVQVNPKQELGKPPSFEGLIIRNGAPFRATLDGNTAPLRR